MICLQMCRKFIAIHTIQTPVLSFIASLLVISNQAILSTVLVLLALWLWGKHVYNYWGLVFIKTELCSLLFNV